MKAIDIHPGDILSMEEVHRDFKTNFGPSCFGCKMYRNQKIVKSVQLNKTYNHSILLIELKQYIKCPIIRLNTRKNCYAIKILEMNYKVF